MLQARTSSTPDAIIQTCEEWYARLRGSEKSNRIATSILAGFLVFLGSLILIIVSDMTPYKLTSYFIAADPLHYLEGAGVVSVIVGVSYYLLSRRRRSNYFEFYELIKRAKSEGGTRSEVLSELVDYMLGILPKIRQGKHDSAFLYGVIAFFLTVFLFPWNLFLAVAIWLYFRYEASLEIQREMLRFDGWQQKLEL